MKGHVATNQSFQARKDSVFVKCMDMIHQKSDAGSFKFKEDNPSWNFESSLTLNCQKTS